MAHNSTAPSPLACNVSGIESAGRVQSQSDRGYIRKRRRILPRTQIQRHPVSSDHALASRLAIHIPRLAPHNAWLQYLPARFGHSPGIDSAALALVASLDFYFGGQNDNSAGEVALREYGASLSVIRNLMQSTEQALSDQVIIAISLIVIFETLMRDFIRASQRNIYSHWSALSAIFHAKRAAGSEISCIVKALLFHLGGVTFCIPVANGKPSQFDCDKWDPTVLETGSTTSKGFVDLHKASHTIRILQPRLISELNRLNNAQSKEEAIFKTVELASRICDSQATEAESSLLHSISIVRSGAHNAHITPYSFRFRDSDQLMALVIYWKSRCAAISLCLHIDSLQVASTSPFDGSVLKAESERCLMNLIMSWEYASSVGPFATLWIARGFISAWRELRGVSIWRGVDVAELKAWILPKVQHPLIEWLPQDSNERDIDLAADVVAGSFTKEFRARAGLRKVDAERTGPGETARIER